MANTVYTTNPILNGDTGAEARTKLLNGFTELGSLIDIVNTKLTTKFSSIKDYTSKVISATTAYAKILCFSTSTTVINYNAGDLLFEQSTSRVTFINDGTYRISYTFVAEFTSGIEVLFAPYKNGSIMGMPVGGIVGKGAGKPFTHNVSEIVSISANDYIEFYVKVGTAASLTLSGSLFEIEKLA
jgi:hypothetical protein